MKSLDARASTRRHMLMPERSLGPERWSHQMTKAIDCLVNVDFADHKQPEWMVRVKEDYFKGGDSFFKSPELPELLEDMDANGVERAILITGRGKEDRAQRFAEAEPDRFKLAVGGFNLLRPMKTVRALESFVRDHPVACATVGPSFWGDGHVPADRPRVLPALHQVLRARSAALHEHRHPRAPRSPARCRTPSTSTGSASASRSCASA